MIGGINIVNKIINNTEIKTLKVKSGENIGIGQYVGYSDTAKTTITADLTNTKVIGITKTPGKSASSIEVYMLPEDLVKIDINLNYGSSSSSYRVGFKEDTELKNNYISNTTQSSTSYYGIARITITNNDKEDRIIRLIDSTKTSNSYLYCYFMNLDTAATDSIATESTSNHKSRGRYYSSLPAVIDYIIPAKSSHFIDIKWRKSSSTADTISWTYDII